jgi:hypothetical protein
MAAKARFRPCGACHEPFEGVGKHICARRAVAADRDAAAKKPLANVWDRSHELWQERNRTNISEPPWPKTMPRTGTVAEMLEWIEGQH